MTRRDPGDSPGPDDQHRNDNTVIGLRADLHRASARRETRLAELIATIPDTETAEVIATLADMETAETAEVIAALDDCESVIERGLATFVEVGEALMAIRDGRLYRQTHNTFASYCRDRWGFDRTYASRLISAHDVAQMLPIGNKPTSEGQARALAPLRDKPEVMAEVMTEVTKEAEKTGTPVTAKRIQEKVDEVIVESTGPLDQTRAAARKRGIEIPADAIVGKTRRHDPHRIIAELSYKLEGVVSALDLVNFDAIDTTQVEGSVTSITESLKALRRFHRQLREVTG